VLLLLPIPTDIKMIELIVAATPIGSNVAVFAQLHDMDYGHAAKLVCNSTILSIGVLPVVVWIASTVFK
jgi:predicted permease